MCHRGAWQCEMGSESFRTPSARPWSWWAPKAVIVRSEPPRTSTGKIRKNVLREEYSRFREGLV